MKRFRIKLVGFGLAALAGSAVGADGEWQPVGKPAPPARVIPAGGEPAPLPEEVRFGALVRPEPPPLWFPAADRAELPPLPAALPDLGPSRPVGRAPLTFRAIVPTSCRAVLDGTGLGGELPSPGPRVGAVPQQPSPTDDAVLPPARPLPPPMLTLEPLAPITPPPGPVPSSSARQEYVPVPSRPVPDEGAPVSPTPPQMSDLPAPRAVDPGATQPRPMPLPVPPPADFTPTKPPAVISPEPPRTVTPAQQPRPGELPAAPPELMIPGGTPVPGKHGTFGSPPIRLSRDYPTLGELHGGSFREHAGLGEANPVERAYLQGEYLMWWATPLDIPVLATTNTQGGFGFLGEPGTRTILGPGEFVGPFRNGMRIRGGWWFGETGGCGLDGSFFFLGRKAEETVLSSAAFPTIGRPFFAPNPRPPGAIPIGEFVESVAFPGSLSGVLTARAESVLWGFDANVRKCLSRRCDSLTTWFAGYRNVNLEESLSITENITVIGPNTLVPDPVGSVIAVQDSFATRNSFHGGQLGATFEWSWGRVSLDARASVALGVTHQELRIDGSQVRTRPGMAPMTFRGGLLAAGPNLGSFTNNEFSVVPEVTLNVGYRVTPALKVFAGYNVMYWTNVIRPGDQIDRVVDLTFVPNAPNVASSGQNRPQPLFRQSEMLLTGLQVGLEVRW